MKPIQFQNREEVAMLITRLAQFNILDDWVMKNPAIWATSALFYRLDKVNGIVIMDGIIPNREASCHIFLFEKPGPQCKVMLEELRKEIRKYFRMFGLKRLAGYIPEYNKPSRRLAVALGFQFEGIKRKATVVHGVYSDLCCYSITDEDLAGVKKDECKLAKHSGADRRRDADDGSAVAEPGRGGLHKVPEKPVAEENDRGAAAQAVADEVRIPAFLRLYRAAVRATGAVAAAIRKPRPDEHIDEHPVPDEPVGRE